MLRHIRMDCQDQEDRYQIPAELQLGYVRAYSPQTSDILESLRPYGAKVLFQAAFATRCYQSLLESMGHVPERFDYYDFIEEYPQVSLLLDQAINCLLEDWLYRCRDAQRKFHA